MHLLGHVSDAAQGDAIRQPSDAPVFGPRTRTSTRAMRMPSRVFHGERERRPETLRCAGPSGFHAILRRRMPRIG
jgi:hypothetical protein